MADAAGLISHVCELTGLSREKAQAGVTKCNGNPDEVNRAIDHYFSGTGVFKQESAEWVSSGDRQKKKKARSPRARAHTHMRAGSACGQESKFGALWGTLGCSWAPYVRDLARKHARRPLVLKC